MNIVVLERNSVGTDVDVSCFEKLGKVTYYENTVTEEEVRERIGEADVVIANKAPMREASLKDAGQLKLICELATGFDNCDVGYCKDRGIGIANVVDYATGMVAQHTFALALALAGRIPHYDQYVKSGEYSSQNRFSNFDYPFYELAGKTWGIVGMGNIGKKVATIAQAFGCRVIFHSITGNSSCSDYERVDKDRLLQESDFLSLHCPLSDLSRYFIDRDALKKMKKSGILINMARGPVVNNTDLYYALAEGEIEAAGLDVVEKEPLEKENPLSQIHDSNKLIITPHLAWASVEARCRCVAEVYRNIEVFLEGQRRNRII